VWGTNVNVTDATARFRRFLSNFEVPGAPGAAPHYVQKLRDVATTEDYSLNLDCAHLFSYDAGLYKLLVLYPQEIIPIFDFEVNKYFAEQLLSDEEDTFPQIQARAARRARRRVRGACGRRSGADAGSARSLHRFPRPRQVRTFNLQERKPMRELNPSDIDTMVCIRGMVTRTSGVIPDLKKATFRCAACGAQPEPAFVDRGRVAEPSHCANGSCRGAGTMGLVHNLCEFANKQQLRMQETPDAIPEGETPHTVSLCAFDELVDAAKPGDRVEVTGVYRAVPMRVAPGQRTLRSVYKTYVDVIHLRKDAAERLRNDASEAERGVAADGSARVVPLAGDGAEADATADAASGAAAGAGAGTPEAHFSEARLAAIRALGATPDVYDALVRSLAPSIWELDDVKRGILCQLFGGTNKELAAGSGKGFRGELNVLLVGDPGVSKSQLLTYVNKLAPRGIYCSGRGSSAVGLTAYVTRDPETRETVLESGALVLSDRGVCCIDEFDKMSDSARSMLHEVMEQQTVSIAKAGIIATLNARTSVLASANPVGSRYNPRLSVVENIQLPPTLLSRFDLIYLVLDKANAATDRRLARHLVALHYETPPARAVGHVDAALLTDYISYARAHVHPQLSDGAAEALVEGYVDMRRLGGVGSGKRVITATPRQLESLVRLSEALARMRLSPIVVREDVAEALRLVKVAMQQAAMDPRTGQIDMDKILTGHSASDRRQRALLADALRTLLAGRPSRRGRLGELLAALKEQSLMEVTLSELRDAAAALVEEGAAALQGDTLTAR
jgi:DNA replication licensing factor MCM4